MILTCPSCDTRYSVDGSKFPVAGRTVRCAKCGNSWHQMGEMPESEPGPIAPEATSESAPEVPVFELERASPMRSFTPPLVTVAEPVTRTPLGPKIAVVAGWAGLIAAILLIGYAAVHYRQ